MYDIFEASTDVFCESLVNEIDSINDDVMRSQFYLEDGDKVSASIITRMKNAVKKLYDWVINTISKFFNKKEVANIKESDVGNGQKIQVTKENTELISEGKKTLTELNKCKTAEDVDTVMDKYHKKQKRIKAAKTAAKTILVLGAAAAVGWLVHTKNKEIEDWKNQQKQDSKRIEQLEKELIAKTTEAAKECATNREKVAELEGKLLGKTKEVEKMKLDAAREQVKGTQQGQIEYLKAKTEVVKDIVTSTMEQGAEIVKAITSPDVPVSKKVQAVANVPKNAAKTALELSEKGAAEFNERNKQLKKKGKSFKESIDAALAVLESDTTNIERREKALNYILAHEAPFRRLGANYATRLARTSEWKRYNRDKRTDYTAKYDRGSINK